MNDFSRTILVFQELVNKNRDKLQIEGGWVKKSENATADVG